MDAGLPEDEVRYSLTGTDFAAEVRDEEQTAAGFGIQGVPFFVVDRALGASGAQPPEQLRALLDQGWEAQPSVSITAASDSGDVDGC